MKFFQKLGSLAACVALTAVTLTFNIPRYSVTVAATAEATSFKTGKIIQVSCGDQHALALDEFGNVWSWGKNSSGQLGDGTTSDRATPQQIMAGTKFVQISAGGSGSCAIDTNGFVYSWGNGVISPNIVLNDQVYSSVRYWPGTNLTIAKNKIESINGWPKHFLGGHVEIRDYGGASPIAFFDQYGQFCYGYKEYSNDPIVYHQKTDNQFASADFQFLLGGVKHTGKDTYGNPVTFYDFQSKYALLGITSAGKLVLTNVQSSYWKSEFGSAMSDYLATSDISSLSQETFKNVCVSLNPTGTAYAITDAGILYSFGGNTSYNLLGSESTESLTNSDQPVQISMPNPVESVSSGSDFSVAVDSKGLVYTWGNNLYGQLGASGTVSQPTPKLVSTFAKTNQYSFVSIIGSKYDGTFAQSGATSYSVVTSPTKGTLSLGSSGDGSFSYTPNNDAYGLDFAQISCVISGITNTYDVNITIDRKPKIIGTQSSFSVDQNSVFSGIVNGIDEDNDTLIYSISTLPGKGSVTIDSSVGNYTYSATEGAAGDDSFEVSVSDGLVSTTLTIAVHIETLISTSDKTSIVINNTQPTTFSGNMGASDGDGDVLTYSVETSPSKGNLTISTDGTYIYTPNASEYGTDSFTLAVTDGIKPVRVQYSVVLYTIEDAGTITEYKIPVNSSFAGSILTSAKNITPSYSISTAPKKGTVNIDSASGKYSYTAGTGYAGSDSFVVTVNYGYGSYAKTINVYLDTAPDVSAIATHVTTNQGVSYTGSVQATDIDAGTTLDYSVSEEPTKGSVTLNEHTGNYTYVPLAASAGDDHFTADVTDGTNIVHVVVYIHIETAISTSTTISKVTSQNTSVGGIINATDADGDALSYSLSSSASHGVASVESATGKYVYIPNTNYYGSDSFVIKVDDGTSPVLVTVNVKVNQKPTTNAPTQSFTTKGQAISGNANCSDPDGDALTYSLSVQPTQGSVILDKSTGAFAYTPKSDAAGNDTFKITATDGCDDIVVTVVVHNETDVVIASQTSDVTVNQGKSTTGQLSASDADGDALTYSVSTQPTKGTLALNENTGAWTYLANSDAKGTDSFTISVTDGNVAKSLTYYLTINTPAEFSSSSKTSVTTNQGENYTDTVSATDADGDKLTYSVVQQGSKGTVTINPDTGRYVYVPTAGAAGDDTFVLGVSDGNFTTELTVRIHIETPITVSGDTQKAETSEGDIATGSVSASDPDGDALTYSISQQGAKGNAAISNDGKWSYFASNGAGEDFFIISISDGTHTVYVTVYVHIDSKPGFDQSSSNVSVGHGQSVSGDATATDADGDTLTYMVSTQPQYGTVDLNSTTGHFTYTSLSNSASSRDSFVVAVTDGKTTAYMTVNVTVNNAPIAQNVSITVGQGGSKDGTVSATDPDGDALTYTIGSQGAKGTATVNTKTGAFTYVAGHDSIGDDAFTVVVSDGLNNTTVSVKVTINANEAPTVENTMASVTNGQSTSGKINATDPNGNPLDFTISQQGTKGVASINESTGEYVYKANLNASGNDTFTVAISNGFNVSNVTVTVSINTTAMTAVLAAVGVIAYTGVVIAAVKLISKGSKKHLEGGAGK